jgi:hypothetical protein
MKTPCAVSAHHMTSAHYATGACCTASANYRALLLSLTLRAAYNKTLGYEITWELT